MLRAVARLRISYYRALIMFECKLSFSDLNNMVIDIPKRAA